VKSGGTISSPPNAIQIPGSGYKYSDPGIHFNIYRGKNDAYVAPGGSFVWT
jgi:hypothetical protein